MFRTTSLQRRPAVAEVVKSVKRERIASVRPDVLVVRGGMAGKWDGVCGKGGQDHS